MQITTLKAQILDDTAMKQKVFRKKVANILMVVVNCIRERADQKSSVIFFLVE